MEVGGYTLHLYCDHVEDLRACFKLGEFYTQTYRGAAQQARKTGWKKVPKSDSAQWLCPAHATHVILWAMKKGNEDGGNT